ncbi:MAG: hypothetical protein ACREQ2_21395 [Candidatus Binatia bacterium]
MKRTSIELHIPVKRIRSLYLFLVGVDGVLLLGYLALRFGTQAELPWALTVIRNQLNLTAENVAAVWYSGMILLLIGLAALLCFHVDSEVEAENRFRKMLRPGWLLIAITFAGFSFDEIGSIHERLDKLLPQAVFGYSGGSSHWVIVLAPIMAVMFLYFFFFFFSHMSQCRWSQVLAVAGTIFLVSVPLQEWVATSGKGGHFQAVMEEATEIIGMTLILTAFLEFAIKSSRLALRGRSAPANGLTGTVPITADITAIRLFYFLATVSAVASLLVAWYFVPLLDDMPRRGDPSAWYPSAALFIAGLIAWATPFIQSESAETKPSSGGMWFVLATACLLLSLEVVSGITALTVAQVGKLSGPALSHQAASVSVTAVSVVLCVVAAGVVTGLKRAAWNRTFVLIGSVVCVLLFTVDSWKAREAIKVLAPTLILISLLESLRSLYDRRRVIERETPPSPNLSAIVSK